MPEKFPFLEANGVILDVDPDKAEVLHHMMELTPVNLPEPWLVAPGPWKEDDRSYFFEHPGEFIRKRVTTEEERELPLRVALHLGQDPTTVEKQSGPFFRRVMLLNISPGCRLKISIDRLSRKPETVMVFSGLAQDVPFLPPGAVFKPAEDYAQVTRKLWAEALQRQAQKGV
jgi:hypothetical protein